MIIIFYSCLLSFNEVLYHHILVFDLLPISSFIIYLLYHQILSTCKYIIRCQLFLFCFCLSNFFSQEDRIFHITLQFFLLSIISKYTLSKILNCFTKNCELLTNKSNIIWHNPSLNYCYTEDSTTWVEEVMKSDKSLNIAGWRKASLRGKIKIKITPNPM